MGLREITAYAVTQIRTDRKEPAAVAKPMGKRVVGKNCEVRYTPGTRTSTMAISLFAPMFCAPSAETVESMEEGTRNRKLMIFSTMPTVAASFNPRRLAMMVMTINAIRIRPSCRAEAEHTHEQVIQSDVGGAGYCNEIHGTFAVVHTAEDGADNVVGGDKGDAYKADLQIRHGTVHRFRRCGHDKDDGVYQGKQQHGQHK